jgi:hypothetical protein
MSYDIVFADPIDEFDEYSSMPSWLYNSYTTIENWDMADYKLVDTIYEQTFNVKIIYPPADLEGNQDSTIVGIQFPTRDEATLFVLRWS